MFFYIFEQSFGKNCPGTILLREARYRLVKRQFGKNFEQSPCYGDYHNCVYSLGHSFFCMNGPMPDSRPDERFWPTRVDEHYNNVKEIITNTTLGSGGDRSFKFNLTGSNEKMTLSLFYDRVEVFLFMSALKKSLDRSGATYDKIPTTKK